jgi:hypothetical protein
VTDPRSSYASFTFRGDLAWALRLANRGYSEEQIFRALVSGKFAPGSATYAQILHKKGRARADAYARRTARKAIAIVREHPAFDGWVKALAFVADFRDKADALPWVAYASPGLRRSLEACFVVAERKGSVRFGLSIREHALLWGHSFAGTRDSRKSLSEMGWLLRNPDDRLGRTSRFRLALPPELSTPSSYPIADPALNGSVSHNDDSPHPRFGTPLAHSPNPGGVNRPGSTGG